MLELQNLWDKSKCCYYVLCCLEDCVLAILATKDDLLDSEFSSEGCTFLYFSFIRDTLLLQLP